MSEVEPARAIAIILGSSEFPESPGLSSPPSFATSSNAFRNYLLNEFGIPAANVLDLFDTDLPPSEIDKELGRFLSSKVRAGDVTSASDLLIHYVGHGGFFGKDRDYYLAIKTTRKGGEGTSSLRIADLAHTLNEHAHSLRRYIILDCCFAASAYVEFQAAPLSVAVAQTEEALPTTGTALLCAAGKSIPAEAPTDEPHTMFTGALLAVLRTGDPDGGQWWTATDVIDRVRRYIDRRYINEAIRPEVHSPKQPRGDVARDVHLFKNPAHRPQDEVEVYLPSQEASNHGPPAPPTFLAPTIPVLPGTRPTLLGHFWKRMVDHRRFLAVVGPLTVMVVIVGELMGPSVRNVKPLHAIVCAGDPVTVSWDATGSTTVEVDPYVKGAPNGETFVDHFTFTPTAAKTMVMIHASRLFRHADAATQIDVDTGELVIGSTADASATCTNNTLVTTAHMPSISGSADELIATVAIDGSDTRSYTISHNGKSVSIDRQHPSSLFAGMPRHGDWTVSTSLPSCDAASIPSTIAFRAFSACRDPATVALQPLPVGSGSDFETASPSDESLPPLRDDASVIDANVAKSEPSRPSRPVLPLRASCAFTNQPNPPFAMYSCTLKNAGRRPLRDVSVQLDYADSIVAHSDFGVNRATIKELPAGGASVIDCQFLCSGLFDVDSSIREKSRIKISLTYVDDGGTMLSGSLLCSSPKVQRFWDTTVDCR